MRIYVLGTGGVGGYFGGRLAQRGVDVTFFDRGDHYDTMKEDGLIVESVKGDFAVKQAKVIKRYSEIISPDIILATTKTYSNEEVFSKVKKYLKPDTAIVSLQNGIVNDFAIQRVVGKEHAVYPGVAFIISRKTKPGVISHQGGLARIIFGARDGSRPEKLEYLEQSFKNAQVDAQLSDDIERDLWKKYIFISAFSGITAITKSTIGEVIRDKTMFKIYETCVQEAIELAELVGVNLPDSIFEDVMTLTVNTVSTAKSSLLHDIEANRKTEIETLNGTLVHLAHNNNLDVPVNEMIYGVIKMWDAKNGVS